MPAERSLATVLGRLFSFEWLAPFVDYMRKHICVHEVIVFDRNVRMVLVTSGFRSIGLCLSSYDHAEA